MDLKQFEMVYGETPWGKKYNDFVEAVSAALEGDKLTLIDSPVIWYDGTSGDSSAYVRDLDDYKLVILTIDNFKTNAKATEKIGQLPASLTPAPHIHLRMDITETSLLTDGPGAGGLCLWGTIANQQVGQYGTCWYLANK